MYDLRYTKVVSEWNPYRNKTTPIVSYAGHTNSHSLRLGFDVSPDGSLLAAGMASLDFLTFSWRRSLCTIMVSKYRAADTCKNIRKCI
jgi:hypothetical protein